MIRLKKAVLEGKYDFHDFKIFKNMFDIPTTKTCTSLLYTHFTSRFIWVILFVVWKSWNHGNEFTLPKQCFLLVCICVVSNTHTDFRLVIYLLLFSLAKTNYDLINTHADSRLLCSNENEWPDQKYNGIIPIVFGLVHVETRSNSRHGDTSRLSKDDVGSYAGYGLLVWKSTTRMAIDGEQHVFVQWGDGRNLLFYSGQMCVRWQY